MDINGKIENQICNDLDMIEFDEKKKNQALAQAEKILCDKKLNRVNPQLKKQQNPFKNKRLVAILASSAVVALVIIGIVIGNFSGGGKSDLTDVPIFIGYKIDDGIVEVQNKSAQALKLPILNGSQSDDTSSVEGEEGDITEPQVEEKAVTKTIFSNSKDILVLLYENPLRDHILDVVIDDSALGKNCVYTKNSATYILRNIETSWSQQKQIFVSEVYIEVPPSNKEGERSLEVMATLFLRDLIEGKADISETAETAVYYDCKLQCDNDEQGISYILADDFSSYVITKSVTDNNVTQIIIPKTFKEKPVLRVLDYAFENNTNITSIKIFENIENINTNFFSNCLNLQEINIDEANQDYSSIDGVLYDKQAKTLIYYPIGRKGSFVIPESVERIKQNTFFDTAIDSLTILDTVQIIENGAVNKNVEIKALSLPFVGDGNGQNQFLGYIFGAQSYEENEEYVPISLTKVEVFGGVVGVGAFYKCKNISEIIMHEDLTRIEDFAFAFSNIKSFNIPQSVNYIGKGAFAFCENLESINSNKTGEFIFGNNIEFLGFGMIAGCINLVKLTVPFLGNDREHDGHEAPTIGQLANLFEDNVVPSGYYLLGDQRYTRIYTTINYYPTTDGRAAHEYFVPTSFKELTVTNASRIEDYGLSGFTTLEKVYFNCEIASVGFMAFDRWTSSQTIYYSGSMDGWNAGWSDFCDADIRQC